MSWDNSTPSTALGNSTAFNFEQNNYRSPSYKKTKMTNLQTRKTNRPIHAHDET